ncbi:MAG: TetR/AcrR family transcriptional regulator [Myxococcales bacterium]|nr:TetR/AcrR family transcriptional regulator [Myxococcales bacterium]
MSSQDCNKSRIMAVAERLFAEHGYAATSVRTILSEAGVTGPTLYHYFGSKEDLLWSLVRLRLDELFGELASESESFTSAEEVFSRFALRALRQAKQHPNSTRLLFGVMFGPKSGLCQENLDATEDDYGQALLTIVQRVAPNASESRVAFAVSMFDGMMTSLLRLLDKKLITFEDETMAKALGERAAGFLSDEMAVPEFHFRWLESSGENGNEGSS